MARKAKKGDALSELLAAASHKVLSDLILELANEIPDVRRECFGFLKSHVSVSKALAFLLERNQLTIQDFESVCPDVNRRSLQRDLKGMLDKELITSEGATHHQEYKLA